MVLEIAFASLSVAGIAYGIYQKKLLKKNIRETKRRYHWYESMLDALPFPLSVTDMNMQWTFINKAAETVTGKKRAEVAGQQCHNWGADICKTDRCGIATLRRGQTTSFFTQPGLDMDFQVDVQYLTDESGAKVGHIEIVQDITNHQRDLAYQKLQAEKLSSMLDLVTSGDLTGALSIDNADKYSGAAYERWLKITAALNKFIESIKSTVGKMSDSTNIIAANSEESSAISNQISTSISEMSTSFTELSKLFQEQRTVTSSVVSLMKNVLDAVKELDDSTVTINKITDVISNIAGQTNLLALNATIEAASAGAAGKGFAVVASEVKNLAQQTTKSSTEINGILVQVTDKVGNLKTLASEVNRIVGEKLDEISNAAAAAVEEQSSVIKEIASSASQTTTSSTELAKLSQDLKSLVGFFKT